MHLRAPQASYGALMAVWFENEAFCLFSAPLRAPLQPVHA